LRPVAKNLGRAPQEKPTGDAARKQHDEDIFFGRPIFGLPDQAGRRMPGQPGPGGWCENVWL
jgi:hypothetical protein